MAWTVDETPPAFECPTGYRVIIRDIDVYSAGGAVTSFTVGLNAVAHFFAGSFTIEATPQLAQWRGRQVMEAGELLVFAADGATDGLISGYQLLLP